MPARALRGALLLFSIAGGFGCSLSVSFDGSRYRCDPPNDDCPPGYTCQAGQAGQYCVPDELPLADAGPDARPSETPDAAVLPPPDGSPPGAVTVTFGERPTSIIQGVTRDG